MLSGKRVLHREVKKNLLTFNVWVRKSFKVSIIQNLDKNVLKIYQKNGTLEFWEKKEDKGQQKNIFQNNTFVNL